MGAGKSSLLSALLGEMDIEEGTGGQVEMIGRLAYVSQQVRACSVLADSGSFGTKMAQ